MMNSLFFILIGYLSGSVLYARIFGFLFKKKDIVEGSRDRNPGTANAFMQGGFWCGICTLFCDLMKGMLPVYCYLHFSDIGKPDGMMLALVLAAPVAGHAFPVFYHWKGGKGIATTFGCLLGLFPDLSAALILAFFFLFFSLVLRVTPHYDRTIWTYMASVVAMILCRINLGVLIGFTTITGIVCIRMHHSNEEREKCRVRLSWKR